jgi:hypothetical protein
MLYLMVVELNKDANDFWASKKLAYPLWNPEDHYYKHSSPPLVPNPSHIIPVHTLTLHFFKSCFNKLMKYVYDP